MMTRTLTAALITALMIATAAADEPLKLQTVQGVVGKMEKETLVVHHKTEKTDKVTTLKLTGTSRFSALSIRKTGDKIVLVQKDIEAKSLIEHQPITVIYATNAGVHVLLTAVVQSE